MHPGGAGTPPAGGGSGAPRPGPARTGQTRGTPTAGARCPPAWHGDPTAPPPGPRTRWSPPAQLFRGDRLDSGVPPTTGCPHGEGNPCHSRVPPGQREEDHQTQLGPPPACRGDAKQTPNTLLESPSTPQPRKLNPQNSRPAPTLGLPQPLICVSFPTPIQAPSITVSPLSAGISLGATPVLPQPPASPLGPHVCVSLYTSSHSISFRNAGMHSCDSAGVCKGGHMGTVVPTALGHPLSH